MQMKLSYFNLCFVVVIFFFLLEFRLCSIENGHHDFGIVFAHWTLTLKTMITMITIPFFLLFRVLSSRRPPVCFRYIVNKPLKCFPQTCNTSLFFQIWLSPLCCCCCLLRACKSICMLQLGSSILLHNAFYRALYTDMVMSNMKSCK